MKSIRLDILLVETGLFPSREIARTAIMDGAIVVNGEKQTKPGFSVSREAKIELKESYVKRKFVSRGGLKLEHALEQFKIVATSRICLDIGASTGGFTDCLLKAGAKKIYAIDVGYGQMDWSLRQDVRVVCLERFNARQLSPNVLYDDTDAWADLAVIDVSFISLSKILRPCFSAMKEATAEAICLIKPQFEIGKDKIGKGGVVKSQEEHTNVIAKVIEQSANLGLFAQGLTYSPLKGPAGNIEFLLHLSKVVVDEPVFIEKIVSLAHAALNK